MIFRRRRGRILLNKKLNVDSVDIEMTDKTKFLGVIIDQYLTFYNHIQHIKGKISRALGILYKGRKYFSQNTLLTLYNAFVYPHFMYCICIWGNAYQTYIEPLFKLQKRAMRLIVGAKRLTQSAPIFDRLKVLQIQKLYIYNVLLFMYKYHNNYLPSIFVRFFVRNNEIHCYNTRQQAHLHIHKQRSVRSIKNMKNAAVPVYNYFLARLNFDETPSMFKRQVKAYLLSNDVSFLL